MTTRWLRYIQHPVASACFYLLLVALVARLLPEAVGALDFIAVRLGPAW